jgi:hypothetical protein
MRRGESPLVTERGEEKRREQGGETARHAKEEKKNKERER